MFPSPPSLSRRQVLVGSALTLTLAGLSGCQETTADTPTATVTEQSFPNTVEDPESLTVRNSEDGPALTSSAHSPQEDFVEEGSDWGDEHWAIGTESERDALQYAQPTTGVEAAQSFVAETDLSAETLVVNQYRIEPCRSMQLDRLQWVEDRDAPDGYYDVDLVYADSDVEGDCDEDAPKDVEATVFRLPTKIEGLSSFGWTG
jgi:hypothetical protein